MKKQIGLMLLIAMLTGCGSGSAWYHREMTVEQAAADCRACALRARTETMARHFDEARDSHVTGVPVTPSELEGMNQRQDFENCMHGKGYRLTKAEWLPKNIKRCHVVSGDQYNTTVAGK